jgi:predicted nuclease with RNAse H fold
MKKVFLGIDVACAKGKRLPVCFVEQKAGRLEPLFLPEELLQSFPRGTGNVAIAEPNPFSGLALQVSLSIQRICVLMQWTLVCAAIDAPAAPPEDQRQCEAALSATGLSVFKTPRVGVWPLIIKKCQDHLHDGGAPSRLPYANMIWMQYGFELFAVLRKAEINVIEVYPFAIARALIGVHRHKSSAEGYNRQLAAVAGKTGWTPEDLHRQLSKIVPGNRHDRLDAFMAAWVASLPVAARSAYGDAATSNDAIWVPAT